MQYKILVIEDDTDINNVIADTLTKVGYICTQAFSERRLCSAWNGKLCTGCYGFDAAGTSRRKVVAKTKRKAADSVIVVSAKDGLDSKVDLLTSGAEDYITKPFEIQELVARVGVQIRRFAGLEEAPKQLQYKDLVLDQASFTAAVNGQENHFDQARI